MKKLITLVALFAPAIALAQNQINNANDLIVKLVDIGNTIITILIAFAVIYIIFNVIMFIIKADDPDGRKEKGKAIGWGIVGLAVILSIWGLVAILRNTFKLNNNAPTNEYPQVNTRLLNQ